MVLPAPRPVLTLALLLVVITCVLSERHEDLLMMERFHRWMEAYGRSYATVHEKMHRFEVYRQNMEYINKVNREEGLTYQLGETCFTDLTEDEFRAKYPGGVRLPPEDLYDEEVDDQNVTMITRSGGGLSDDAEEVPDSKDWVEEGCVTGVKNQKRCAACWAFAAVAAIESAHKISGGDLVSLSEQELVDCDTYDSGCKGGNPYYAYKWVQENDGIALESDYHYVGQTQAQKCRASKLKLHSAKLESYGLLQRNREDRLKVAVARQPVAILFKGYIMDLMHYKCGVYNGRCAMNYNHSMAIVGYGRRRHAGKDVLYWKAKNSWGSMWGEDGYIFLSRNTADRAGCCGLATYPSYPVAKAFVSHAST